MLVLAVSKSVSVFSVHSGVQEELAVLLSLLTPEAVQTTSSVIVRKSENAVTNWMLLTKFPPKMFPPKSTAEKAERRKAQVETIIVSQSQKIG